MRAKKWLCILLAVTVLMSLPVNALAKSAKPSIKLSQKVRLMFKDDTGQILPKLTGVKASAVKCSSSDSGVAKVSAKGLVKAVGAGRAVITLKGGGAKAKCGIVVLPRQLSVKAGESYKLPCGGVESYKMKDKKIATVSKKGVVTGKKAGVTTLTVKYGKQSMKLLVDVTGGKTEQTAVASQSKAAELDAAKDADQIVLVEYTGGSSATLSAHEKKDGVWTQILETPAYVGKNGIGKTEEGDKKTPEGTYDLTTPLGIKDDPGAKLAYTKVTKYHYWCGDSDSIYYNQLVDSRETGREYTDSDEHLIDYKGAYNYCMFIGYNTDAVAHKGSCIFLHCFGSKKYTAGCVAIDEKSMKKIIKWADDGAKIVIKNA